MFLHFFAVNSSKMGRKRCFGQRRVHGNQFKNKKYIENATNKCCSVNISNSTSENVSEVREYVNIGLHSTPNYADRQADLMSKEARKKRRCAKRKKEDKDDSEYGAGRF